MPDDQGDRTETPTPRRRQEAREKGQVAKSTDLNAAIILLGAMLCLRMFGARMLGSLLTIMQRYLTVEGRPHLDVDMLILQLGILFLSAIGPMLVGLIVLSLIANVLQVGLLFTTHPLTPKLDKLNPINGITRMFSSRTVVQLGMNLLKLTVLCFITYFAVTARMDQILLAMAVGGMQQIALLSTVLYDIGLQLAIVLFVLALIDYAWQRYRFERDLRMTKQEVKEELRRMEGDPLIKQRRRKMQLAATLQQIRSAVPQADVVVTNPTELAIAIQYDMEKMAAPRVVAKGGDYLAQKIREVAIEFGIPIVERKPLAQALFKTVEVGQEVPEQFYQAIAEVLAYVYRLSGRNPAPRAAPAA